MSVFSMEDVAKVAGLPIGQAKEYAISIVTEASDIKNATRMKAQRQILKAPTSASLATTMTNWILAHPSEGLKVIK